ncbi:DMT family transporter [Streptomyces qinglanensis]|uniref:Quaternary ammonium compound-resistance protein SugE n=1 Tax=Streptomyces qinglanensis TaxID=943816 RepID=A0A1H9PIE9_9ACTN|nr:multidrug efflux SMR transporter [Streptomyces qinglanensis]SER47958.1 quaternary ammonium compound-resistance protein SugE [Streptomyces qinglanensis]
MSHHSAAVRNNETLGSKETLGSNNTVRHDDTTGGGDAAARSGRARAWLVLLLAGAFEVGYALAVGGSHGFTVLSWSLVAVVFFLLTLFSLSLALRTLDVGIGYAVWAGIGAVGAALLGPAFFDETLTPAKALWLTVIIAGVVWLKLADRPQHPPADELPARPDR